MAAYKVINLDSPIESDYWVDIPVRDSATNKDAVDEEGRILVQRHVTRSIKNEELASFTNAVETVNTLKEDYSTFKEELSTKVNNHDSSILTNTNNITTLTDSVNNHDLQINALYSKINAIKGIDIDDFKLVTETDIKNIKSSYLPLAGGTLTGAVTINNDLTVTGTVTSTFHGNLTGDVTGNLTGNLTGDVVGNVTGNITGSANSAINDSINRSIVETYALKSHYPDNIDINWDTTLKGYVNLTVDQTTYGLITTDNIAQQSVNYANSCNTASTANTAKKATNADNTTNLGGYPATDYIRSVNGINADASGNVQLGNIGAITGEIKWFAFNTPPDGYLICNGAKVSRTTYADLFAVIGTTFGSGDGSTTFALPNLINKFVQGSTTIGTYKSAGLPNITGERPDFSMYVSASGNTGALTVTQTSYSLASDGDATNCRRSTLSFDASKSNPIYGNSETVQPPALTLLPCIKY